MTRRKYLGPATNFDGKDVPVGGLAVDLSDAQVRALIARGHVFDGKDGDILRTADLKEPAATGGAQNAPKESKDS
jgi:hypothetical protein